MLCVLGWLAALGSGCGALSSLLDNGEAVRACEPSVVAALMTDRYQLFGADGPEGQASLLVLPLEGEPPYTYRWHVVDGAGRRADGLLDATDIANPRFTATAPDGPYDVFCTVTDARGCPFTDKLVLTIGVPVGLDMKVTRLGVVAGGGEHGRATIHLTPRGGPEPYRVSWSVTAPDGREDPERLEIEDPFAPVFISSEEVGTYVVTGMVRDATGAEAVESVIVVVGQHLGLDVSVSRPVVIPGGGAQGSAMLLATPIGGKGPYTYRWEITGPDDEPATELLSAATAHTPIFESGDVSGHYLARCTVTDADGITMIGSTSVVVGQQVSVDVIADRVVLVPAGGTTGEARLSADVRGGRGLRTLTWTVIGPDGQENPEPLSNIDTTEVTFTSSETSGVFVVRCSVTDADGFEAIDSVRLIVRSGLSLDVTADRVFAPPLNKGSEVKLTASPLGGQPPYDYVWTTTGGTLVGETSQDNLELPATIQWRTTVPGTYTIHCTATDSTGQTFRDSIAIVVSTPEVFSLDVTSNEIVVFPGEAVNLTADRTGGTALFNFTWTAISESGASVGGFAATAQNGRTDDTTNTWTAPSGANSEGTYRIRCTVTDAAGAASTDTVLVEVSALAVQNTFLAPPATDTAGILGATALTAASGGADPGQQILAGSLTHPNYPRNVVITITDGDLSITGGTARVSGIDARGISQTEVITIGPSFGGLTTTGVKPFATVTGIDLYSFAGVDDGVDQIRVGMGAKFGLTAVVKSVQDVQYVNEDGVVKTGGYTLDLTVGQVGITFETVPNGARNYVVVIRAR